MMAPSLYFLLILLLISALRLFRRPCLPKANWPVDWFIVLALTVAVFQRLHCNIQDQKSIDYANGVGYGELLRTFRTKTRLSLCRKNSCWVKGSLLLLLIISGDVSPNPGPAAIDVPSTPSNDVPCSADLQPVLGSANVCGLRSKALNLEAEFLVPYSFAAFALQETKLPASCPNQSLCLRNYTLFRKDRNASGGGVAIYVQNSLNPRRLRSRIPALLELVAVEAYFGARRLILASVYLPPCQRPQMEDRISDLNDWIASLGVFRRDLVLLGDLNLCPLDLRRAWEGQALHSLCQTFNLHQVVTEPTHNQRLIDHCLLGDMTILHKFGLAHTLERKKKGQADGHSSIWIQLQHLRLPRPNPVVIDSWKWADFDVGRALFLLFWKPDGDP